MVYAIQRGADGLITIRSGANIRTRLRFLRREFASDYRLLAAVPGGKLERENIEEQLRPFGAGERGWYKPAPDVLRLIDEFRGGRFPAHVVVNGRSYALLRVSW